MLGTVIGTAVSVAHYIHLLCSTLLSSFESMSSYLPLKHLATALKADNQIDSFKSYYIEHAELKTAVFGTSHMETSIAWNNLATFYKVVKTIMKLNVYFAIV